MGDESKEQEYISYSRLSSYVCPAYGYYGYERNLEPAHGGVSVFLVAGSAGHAAIDTFYRTDSIDEMLDTFHKKWIEMGGSAFDVSGESLNAIHMEKVLINYANGFAKDAYEPVFLADMLGESDLASEMEATVEFDEVSWPVKMILDRLVKHRHTGRLEVWDTKFTAAGLLPYTSYAPPPDAKYMQSYQIPLYALAWRELTGLDIQAGKIEAVYMGTGRKHSPGETRLISIFDRWDEEIREETLGWVEARLQEIRWRRDTGYWPQIDGARQRQYVCYNCQFRPLCEARPSAREGLIQLNYKERERK
jgi:hypothetical protein